MKYSAMISILLIALSSVAFANDAPNTTESATTSNASNTSQDSTAPKKDAPQDNNADTTQAPQENSAAAFCRTHTC